MLGKLVKHDLNYSKKSFLSIAVVAIVLSVVAPLGVLFDIEAISIVSLSVTGTVLVAMFVISIILIFNGYKKSLFEQNGYLFLTLPVSKNKLLLSKTIGALIWANFMGVVIVIMTGAIVFVGTHIEPTEVTINFDVLAFIPQALYGILYGNVAMFTTIIILFMTITLANSSFKSKRLHWVLAGVLGLVYYIVYVSVMGRIQWHLSDTAVDGNSIFYMTLLLIYSLVVGIISYFITLYLLRNRIELD